MQRYTKSAPLILVLMTTFWAYTVADSLIREFSQSITLVDLAVLYVMGLIAGIGLGLLFAQKRKGLTSSREAQ